MAGNDRCGDAAARGKRAGHGHAPWLAGLDQVIEDLVGGRLVKNALVSVFEHVVFQGFQLKTGLAGHILDPDLAEVRQARLGAHGREFRAADVNFVVAFGARIRERFEWCGHAGIVDAAVDTDWGGRTTMPAFTGSPLPEL